MLIAKQWRLHYIVAFCVCLITPEVALGVPNATITNGTAQLRKSYPTFGVSTLWRFRLQPGDVVTTIPEGSRVEVSKRAVVSTQEWFETTYGKWKGWVYAGEVGATKRHVQLDPGVRVPQALLNREPAQFHGWLFAIDWVSAQSVYAQAPRSDVVEAPPVKTAPAPTLLLGLAHVTILLGTLFVAKKWIFKSNIYTLATGLFVILIFGFISERIFGPLLTQFLTVMK